MTRGYRAHVLTDPRVFWLRLPPLHFNCRCVMMTAKKPLQAGQAVTTDDVEPLDTLDRPLIKMSLRDHADATEREDWQYKALEIEPYKYPGKGWSDLHIGPIFKHRHAMTVVI